MADEDVTERVRGVEARIAAACARCGRDPADVALVAVSKKQTPDRIREVADCGLRIFGENRVQEAAQKIELCPGHIEWHLVGHLQSNKVKHAVRLFRVLHSVDSLRLLEQLDAACDEAGSRLRVLLQVNVSGESSKSGMAPEGLREAVEAGAALRHVDVAGVMTIPPFTEDPEGARPVFRRLRELRDEVAAATGVPLDGLSMGMSHDFEIAIEEGATCIRLGTVLFGPRAA
jgi:pyridoxal phosphate enzyme (YggS family)